ncbi:MAG: RHS repeat-associated core domain-containing protein [Actinomycetota bacterium]|jgi:RHS repeat-associated protein|nr:RHS repeat-associated core domain-containing protein [Actinomycetota bacterium]
MRPSREDNCVERTSLWAGQKLLTEFNDDRTRCDYLYGPNSMPLQLMVTASNGTTSTYAYQVDHGGSVISMTDEDGDEVARYAYDPYGGLVGMSGDEIATRNPLLYRGYYYDNETQLYYLPARYYNPDTARFLSVDPAPLSAGDPTSLNGYAYCVGDPVNASDPTGAIADIVYECPRGVSAGVYTYNRVSGKTRMTEYEQFLGRLGPLAGQLLGSYHASPTYIRHMGAPNAGNLRSAIPETRENGDGTWAYKLNADTHVSIGASGGAFSAGTVLEFEKWDYGAGGAMIELSDVRWMGGTDWGMQSGHLLAKDMLPIPTHLLFRVLQVPDQGAL